MINKKAQAGKIIATFPVLIIIVIILALYIILSAGTFVINKPAAREDASLSFAPENNLLLKTIIFEQDGIKKEYILYDAVYLKLNKDLDLDEVRDTLKSLLTEQNNCFILHTFSEPSGTKGYQLKKGFISQISTVSSTFETLRQTMTIKGKETNVIYYPLRG